MAVGGGLDLATLGLRLDAGQMVAGAKDADRSLRQLGTTADKSEGTFRRLQRAAVALGAAFAGLQAARFARESVNLGARYETLGVVMEVVGRNVGKTTLQMQQFQSALQRTGISAIQSRNQLARMVGAQIDLANATQLARIAQDAAVIANLNSSDAFEHLIGGISQGRTIMLRTLGIFVDFNSALQQAAQETGRTVQELSELEKTQIRANAVIAAGSQIAGAYESALETAGKQIRSAERYLEDARIAVSQAFQPVYTALVFAYADALKAVGQNAQVLSAGLIALIATLGSVAAAIAIYKTAVVVATAATVAWNAAMIANLVGLGMMLPKLLTFGAGAAGVLTVGAAFGVLAARIQEVIVNNRIMAQEIEDDARLSRTNQARRDRIAHGGQVDDRLRQLYPDIYGAAPTQFDADAAAESANKFRTALQQVALELALVGKEGVEAFRLQQRAAGFAGDELEALVVFYERLQSAQAGLRAQDISAQAAEQRALNAAFGEGARAQERIRLAYQLQRDLVEDRAKFSAQDAANLAVVRQELYDAQIAALDLADNAEAKARFIAQLEGSVGKHVGKTIQKHKDINGLLGNQATKWDTILDRVQAVASAYGTLRQALQSGDPIGGALGGATAGTAITGTPIGGVVGAGVGFFAGLLGGTDETERALRDLERAMRDLAISMGPPTVRALQQVRAEMDDLRDTARHAFPGAELDFPLPWLSPERVEEFQRVMADINRLEAQRLALVREEIRLRNQQIVEDSAVRILRAQGKTAEADALAFRLRQQREFNQAVRDGASIVALAMLKMAQAAEAAAREAELARQAKEERERALVVAVDAARQEVDAARAALDATLRTIESLREASRAAGGRLETPGQAIVSARAEFERFAALARAGDQEAAQRLPELARLLLDASRAFNASGQGFVADVQFVQGVLDSLADQFGAQASIERETLDTVLASYNTLLAQLDELRGIRQSGEDDWAVDRDREEEARRERGRERDRDRLDAKRRFDEEHTQRATAVARTESAVGASAQDIVAAIAELKQVLRENTSVTKRALEESVA